MLVILDYETKVWILFRFGFLHKSKSLDLLSKTRAMDLYQSGVPLTHIQQLLGHEDLSTTSGFYAFATLDTLAKAMNKVNEESTSEKKWNSRAVIEKLLRL